MKEEKNTALCMNRMFSDVIAFTEVSDATGANLLVTEFTELAGHNAGLRHSDSRCAITAGRLYLTSVTPAS